MKKYALLSILTLGSLLSVAQPVITGPTNNPVAGDRFFTHTCVTSGVSRGPGGGNVDWDFHALKLIGPFEDSTVVMACSATPYCDSITYAKFGIMGASFGVPASNGWGYKYYVTDTNKLYQVAAVRPHESWKFSDFYNEMMYPMGYGTIKVDTYYKSQPTFGNVAYGIDSFIGDGYGTLRLPTTIYGNVVRVHYISNYGTSTGAPGFPSSSAGRLEEYRWYTPGYHDPLLVIRYEGSANSPASHIHFSSLSYYVTSVADASTYVGNVEISPNPVSDAMHISFDVHSSCTASISITDMLGRTMGTPKQEQLSMGKANISYDVSSLPVGLYILRIETPSGAMQQKIQVTR